MDMRILETITDTIAASIVDLSRQQKKMAEALVSMQKRIKELEDK